MIDIISSIHPAVQALIATIFTWAMTALGALPVMFFRNMPRRILNGLLAFSGGVMLSAACWSLLIPALEQAAELGMEPVRVAAGGFVAGGIMMKLGEKFSYIAEYAAMDDCSGMLMFSITLHNIPEGMCVGVAFGASALGIDGATLGAAWMLALGIGLQNLPEGAAVSLPMLRAGMSRRRAFFMGQLSGMVEPVAGVAGALMVIALRPLLPFLLAVAAGAMVYAVAGEIFPESRSEDACSGSAIYAVAGFAIMMALDAAMA